MGALMVGMILVAVAIVLAVQIPRWRADAAAKETAAAQAKVLKEMYKDVWEFRRPDEPNVYSQYRSFCRRAVLDRLKSPGSAKFVSMFVTVGDGRPKVLGNVDAQNSYGGLLRATYSCPFGPDGLVDLQNVLIFTK